MTGFLCISSCPGTHYVDQVSFELVENLLRLKESTPCLTMISLRMVFVVLHGYLCSAVTLLLVCFKDAAIEIQYLALLMFFTLCLLNLVFVLMLFQRKM